MATVFSAFPGAVVFDRWEIGRVDRATETGDIYTDSHALGVIEDVAQTLATKSGEDAEGLKTSTLLYAKPEELPSVDPAALIAGHMVKDVENSRFYRIDSVGIGKNQLTGRIEHVELILTEVEALDEQ